MVINESFSEGNTFIHKLDPRVRLFSAFAFSLIISVTDIFQALIPALIISFILLIFARLPLKGVFLRLLAANLFIFLLSLLYRGLFPLSRRVIVKLAQKTHDVKFVVLKMLFR